MNPGQQIENYLEWMRSKAYSKSTIRVYGYALTHFQQFLETGGILWEDGFQISTITAFQNAKGCCFGPSAVKGFARYLYQQGLIFAPIRKQFPILPMLYEDFLVYFASTRGIQEAYLMSARWLLTAFNNYLVNQAVDLAKIRIEQVDDFLARRNAPLQPSTQRQNRSHLRNFFKYLYYERRILKRNIAPLIVGATVFGQNKPPKFLRDHEIRQVFAGLSAGDHKALRQAAMVHLGYTLGLRPKEVGLILLDDIFFSQGAINLPYRKSDNPITLPLPENTIKVIAAYLIGARPQSKHRQLFLNFSAPYAPVTATTVSREITNALKCVNPRATAYWLRHTYAQNMLQAGVGLFQVKEMMGHDCIQSTQRYLHIDLDLMRGLF